MRVRMNFIHNLMKINKDLCQPLLNKEDKEPHGILNRIKVLFNKFLECECDI